MQIASPFSQRNKKETGFRKLFIEAKLTTTLSTLRILYLHCEIAHLFVPLVQDHIVQNVTDQKQLNY